MSESSSESNRDVVAGGLPPAGAAADRPALGLREISRDGKGRLVARLDGRDEPAEDVRVARCFPWSLPDSLISVRDKEGNELVLLETLDGLPPATRELIEAELRDKVFAPRIQKILSFQERFDITTITAQTDRGEVTFQLRGQDDVRVLSPFRCILKDVDGNLYEAPDTRQMDKESRRHLQGFF